ncbi:Crp/Fnr family transcriptional regulator [Salirhabdus euzebyi]|nr:Crp/Fnr family transcriptional regulator [Salirhabdus euzebyi]
MKTESIFDQLYGVPLFKSLTLEEMKPVINIASVKTYTPGMHVFLQGEELKNVYFIHHGKVKIYKTDLNGKEQIVNVLQAGDMFPHAGFFRQDSCPAHAEIIENVTLIYIPIILFEHFLIQHPEVCIKLFRVLGDKIVDLQVRLEEQIFHNSFEQIMMLLLRLSKVYGKPTNGGEKVTLTTNFTNRELANMIGTSRETVSRTLTQLKKNNIVLVNSNGEITIDTVALETQLF